jgi:hypothetical protein
VMGWMQGPMESPHLWRREDGRLTELPKFSTDVASAWQVVEKLGPDDIFLTVRLLPDGHYECGAYNEIGDRLALSEEPSVKAETAPLAICRAALLATGSLPQPYRSER